MPIKPENKKLYPKNWKEIRAEVLERDGYRCKWCGAKDKELYEGPDRIAWIVLTTAHIDHDPTNNGEPGNRPNLAALCQKCHLTHDAKHHAKTARETRRSKLAIADMFGGKND